MDTTEAWQPHKVQHPSRKPGRLVSEQSIHFPPLTLQLLGVGLFPVVVSVRWFPFQWPLPHEGKVVDYSKLVLSRTLGLRAAFASLRRLCEQNRPDLHRPILIYDFFEHPDVALSLPSPPLISREAMQ